MTNKLSPKPHQLRAIKDIVWGENGIIRNDRAQYISACGTGKTLTSMWANTAYLNQLNSIQNETISVFMYPSLALISQSYKSFSELLEGNFEPLIVCSEQKIGQKMEDPDDNIDSDFNYPTCTESSIVKSYLNDERIKSKIVMVTYHSAQIVAEALKKTGKTVDITIYDEAHKTAHGIDGMMSYSLTDNNFPSKKRLFMTATPKHASLESEDIVFNMGNEDIYGKVAHELSMREAIDQGLITDYLIIGGMTNEKIDPENKSEIMTASINALIKAIREEGAKKIMLFSESIALSKETVDFLNEKYFHVLEARHIDGSMKHFNREDAMDFIKSTSEKIHVLSNSKLLSEGVDVPAVDMIAFLNTTKSEIDIVQRVGRVQRLDADNPSKIGKIFVPIIVDELGDIINGEKQFLDTILSLKENDENLKSILSNPSWNSGNMTSGIKFAKTTDFDDKMVSSVYAHLHRNIRTVVLGGFIEAQWYENYNKTKTFTKYNGRLPSYSSEDEDEKKLGIWVVNQRSRIKKGYLSNERISFLQQIPDFFKTLDEVWMETYIQVKEFTEREGRKPSKKTKNEDEKKLSRWCFYQRNNNNRGLLSKDRKDLLELIPDFFKTFDDAWVEAYTQVKEFVEKEGKLPSSTSKDEDEKKLGTWCFSQRSNNNMGLLSKDRKDLLELIPDFFKTLDEVWMETYIQVKEFVEKEGKLPSLGVKDQAIKKLSRWCATQRKNNQKGLLSKDRKDLLDLIPDFFKTFDDAWVEAYVQVKEFTEREGRTPSSTSKDEDEKKLGTWCATQRKNNQKGLLSKDRKDLLDLIPDFFKDRSDNEIFFKQNIPSHAFDTKKNIRRR